LRKNQTIEAKAIRVESQVQTQPVASTKTTVDSHMHKSVEAKVLISAAWHVDDNYKMKENYKEHNTTLLNQCYLVWCFCAMSHDSN